MLRGNVAARQVVDLKTTVRPVTTEYRFLDHFQCVRLPWFCDRGKGNGLCMTTQSAFDLSPTNVRNGLAEACRDCNLPKNT